MDTLVTAALSWDPAIQGILAVTIGVVVLMGSVYLLLGTNLGARLGFLIALTGFFGWMVILGLIWTVYGIGWKGADPSWHVEEVVIGDLDQAVTEEARELSDWEVVPPERRGEMQAVVEEFLNDELFAPAGEFGGRDFVVLEGFETGGKPEPESDALLDRLANRITNTLRVFHPTHFALIRVQPAIEVEADPLAPPPPLEADPAEPVVSVVLVRDLGNLRQRPALLTLACLIVFVVLAWTLHRRDKLAQRVRAGELHPDGEEAAALPREGPPREEAPREGASA